MDPLVNLNEQIYPHILFNLEPVELLPVMQVSHFWCAVAANELDRMIFLKYVPGEERVTYRSKYGVESPDNLFYRMKAFIDDSDKTKTRSFICHFPFNPSLFVMVKIYSTWKDLGDEVEIPMDPDNPDESTFFSIQEQEQLMQEVIKTGSSWIDEAEIKSHCIAMKKLSDEEDEKTFKWSEEAKFLAHYPVSVSYVLENKISVFISDQTKQQLAGYSTIVRYISGMKETKKT